MDIWNPWHGCRKYTEGCDNCYMFYLDEQHGQYGGDIYRVKGTFDLPLQKKRDGTYRVTDGSMLHACMTSDFFLEEADEWRPAVWDMIRRRPGVTFWLQTKRISRVPYCLPPDFGDGWANVHFCVTAENDARAKERLPQLLALPFRHKHVMCAPLLSGIDLSPYLASGQIESVLADGENYAGARPCRYEWVASLCEQCREADVPFHFVGTGNRFVKDGHTYHVPKAYQKVEALRSGLQHPPPADVPPIRKKCASCKMRHSCGGCKSCGRCDREPDM